MKTRLLYLLLLFGLIYSCKKEKLPTNDDTDASPVFYLKGEVNGLPIKIEAGVNDYYMVSSHYYDKNNLYVYCGQLKQNNCSSNCGFALAFEINDTKFSALNTAMDANAALKSGNYKFNNRSIKTFYDCRFTPNTTDNGTGDYVWTFSDDSTPQPYSPTKSVESGKNYRATFRITAPSGLSSELTQDYKIGNPLQANIVSEPGAGLTRNFSAQVSGNPPFTYNWDFGDGTSNAPAPTHSFSAQKNSIVTLTISDNDGNTCVAKYLVPQQGFPDPNFTSIFTPKSNSQILSAINVRLTDPSGVTYAASDITQPAGSKFEIISVEDYLSNNQKEPTKKVKINFSCSFSSPNGPINITNGEAVIAVSYK